MRVRYKSDTQLSGPLLAVTRLLWLVGFVAAVGTYVLTLSGRYLSLHSLVAVGRNAVYQLGLTASFYAQYHISFEVLFALASTAMGVFIFIRRSDDWMAIFMSLTLIMYGTRVDGFPIDAPRLFYRDLRALTDGVMSVGMIFSLVAFYIFPTGRFEPRWTRWLALIWTAWVISWVVFPDSPVNMLRWRQSIDGSWPAYVAQVFWYGTGAVAQLIRYRQVSSAVERQQTKWVVFGLVFVVVAYFVLNFPYAVVPSLQRLGTPRVIYGLVHKPLMVAALTLIPVCYMVATLRYRLWDIGIVINRTLVYSMLTVMLAVIYGASILLMQQVFQPIASQTSPLAIAASTLVTATLFTPVRQRTQHFIDRRFYRARYDTAQTLASFSAMLRDQLDLTRLSECLEDVISETVQPSHAMCWLRTPTGYNIHLFADDQQQRHDQALSWALGEIALDDPLVGYIRRATDVVELERVELESPALERMVNGGVVLAVPLVSQGDLVGWLSLGGRLSELGYSTDDRRMLTALASQAAPAFRVAQLVREQKAEAMERERLQQELKIARSIQQTLLPKDSPPLPGWELSGFYQPAQAVGGDFYDYIPFDDGRLGIVIGDVTDKGIPAALVMATTRSLIRSAAHQLISPGLVLRRVNRLLQPDIPPAMFVTCLYAVLDPLTGTLRYANAGHNLPFRRAGGEVSQLHARGMPLGLMPGMEYEEQETVLVEDECVLFYSDGLVEAHNPWREMFGGGRVSELMAAHYGDGPSLIECLLGELSTFTVAGSEQEDDVTLVTLHRREGHGAS